jgi:SAM-dependent methyltransferase
LSSEQTGGTAAAQMDTEPIDVSEGNRAPRIADPILVDSPVGSPVASYVQFGCGTCAPSSWRNFDAGPAFWLERHLPILKPTLLKRGFPDYPANIEYGNVVKGLPVAPGSAEAVYCSHVLEHLALDEFRATLRNVLSHLRPGGTFRFVLPDLEALIRGYARSSDAEAASRFMRESYLGMDSQGRGLPRLLRALFGRSAHLWMWDEKSMTRELADAGFTAIRRAQMGDNPDPQFAAVEDAGRWENCLGMECRRPT